MFVIGRCIFTLNLFYDSTLFTPFSVSLENNLNTKARFSNGCRHFEMNWISLDWINRFRKLNAESATNNRFMYCIVSILLNLRQRLSVMKWLNGCCMPTRWLPTSFWLLISWRNGTTSSTTVYTVSWVSGVAS